MQIRRLFCFIVSTGLLLVCGCNKTDVAKSADFMDFKGKWVGKWSWDDSKTVELNINSGKALLLGFPDQSSLTPEYVKAEFHQSYGSKAAPAVLLFLNDQNLVVPIYISKDKKRLIYTYDINYDQTVVFDHTK